MAEADIHIQASSSDATLPTKRAPSKSAIPVPFSYMHSDDGTDENLLILLHGLGKLRSVLFSKPRDETSNLLGDTHVPFAKLGRQLKLPQTAVLVLRAPEQYVTS